MWSNISDWVLDIGTNGSVNYFAAEEREIINVSVRRDGLHAISMAGFTSAGEGPKSNFCYFNVSCYVGKEEHKHNTADNFSGISQ